MGGPLDGLTVLDLTSTITGAQITQTLADFGADVTMVERPGGNPLRVEPAWPFWARGKHSVVLDLHDPDEARAARGLAAGVDVVVETWRPGVAERLGLDYDTLAAGNPRLVYASATAFGRDNPLSHLKGYEPVVLAKLGALESFSLLVDRPGPAFAAAPYGTFSASQTALHGILAALVERESSGLGQHVETTMVQALLAHDTWNWLVRLFTKRYPDAFQPQAAASKDSSTIVPNSPLFLRLMVGYTEDGRFMQFSQMSDRLWNAFLRVTGLLELVGDEEFTAGRTPDDPEMRIKWLEKALDITRSKTYAEWLEVFDHELDVWAEMFRDGNELLDHPQLVHDGRIVTIDDPEAGAVRQPGPLVTMFATPAQLGAPAPGLDADHDRLATAAVSAEATAAASNGHVPSAAPLTGLTVLELGTFYAAPFGSTLLTDLGARVIKVEQPGGDPIRYQAGFPEIGAIKVLQGKESVAIDIGSDRGRQIVLELARRADVVLQSFRAGVAERLGYTGPDFLAVNPDLVYLNAPGYGTGAPYGQRPAFAPTIGAGAGLGYRNLGGRENDPADPSLPTSRIRECSTRMSMATLLVGTADGFSALGVGTALLLGTLAKQRGGPGQEMATSMLSTMAHCLSEDMVDYEGRAPITKPDHDLFGLSARYRLYETADGWVFLAAPQEDEWRALASALDLDPALGDDDAKLTAVLAERFATGTAAEWETRLAAVDVACVEVATSPVEEVVWFDGHLGETLGIVTETTHPMLDTYPRLKATVQFSRSATQAGPAPLCGEQTDAVLGELGYTDADIADLRANHIIL